MEGRKNDLTIFRNELNVEYTTINPLSASVALI